MSETIMGSGTEVDGNGWDQAKEEPGHRDDGRKLRWHLIPIPALLAFCRVWHAGGKKYGDGNWRKGMSYSRIYRSMHSHLYKWLCTNSSYDNELGTHHLMMVAWGCFVLYMYEIVFKYAEFDDRPDKDTMTEECFELEREVAFVPYESAVRPKPIDQDDAAR